MYIHGPLWAFKNPCGVFPKERFFTAKNIGKFSLLFTLNCLPNVTGSCLEEHRRENMVSHRGISEIICSVQEYMHFYIFSDVKENVMRYDLSFFSKTGDVFLGAPLVLSSSDFSWAKHSCLFGMAITFWQLVFCVWQFSKKKKIPTKLDFLVQKSVESGILQFFLWNWDFRKRKVFWTKTWVAVVFVVCCVFLVSSCRNLQSIALPCGQPHFGVDTVIYRLGTGSACQETKLSWRRFWTQNFFLLQKRIAGK